VPFTYESGACVHCGRPCRLRPRNLCLRCWSDLDVRHQYPPRGPKGRRSWDDDLEVPPPETATATLPGTEGRIEELARRVKYRQNLHRPDDAYLPD
jgi:hypothetical protein